MKPKSGSSGVIAPSTAISPFPTSGFSSFTESSPTQVPKTKYDIDSDGDAIPDFVETAIGFDPNYNNALTCVKKSCEASGQQTAQSAQTNILFILDASGSMAESIAGGIKMDLAKQALKKYAESVSAGTNVGLMVYGHKGSNNPKDKTVSCAGIETVYQMGEMNKSVFESAFSGFSPTGWTVIGGSLRKSAEVFAGKDGQNNHVIVISDGIETCGSDPAGAAKELKNLSINPQIDVIGLAVDAAARAQLEEVAKIGGGTYKPANSAVELEDALKKTIDAARQSLVCSFKTSTAYQNCLILEQYRPASQYLQNLQLQALRDKNMEEESAIRRAKSKLLDYWVKLYSQDVTISTKANQELYRQYEDLRR
ncbi:MAG: VWA domain-containing protein, partial [Candidatus Moranbacteria bacterium]|nr:VWA domain-containing protein [Candidatus Moranbacteria bacterium]